MPYYDYDGFGERYFMGRNFADGGNPAGYTYYTPEFAPFDRYARNVIQEANDRGKSLENKPVLVVGCATGFTVDWLVQEGVDAYGMDLSSWAVGNAPASVADRIYQGDLTVESDLKSVVQAVKPGGNKFDMILTEAMLSSTTDAEAQEACANARTYSKDVLHRVWTVAANPDYYNKKTLAEWQSLVDSKDEDYWVVEHEFTFN